MSIFGVKLPDVGEGVAEAELVEWYVAVGDPVTPATILADVMTDKTTVEVTSPVSGVVTFLVGEPGDVLAVGTEFVGIEVDVQAGVEAGVEATVEVGTELDRPGADDARTPTGDADPPRVAAPTTGTAATRAIAAPAVRERASALGVDLGSVVGSGPGGRVLHADLDRHLTQGRDGRRPTRTAATASTGGRHDETVRGLRRRIAERLTTTWAQTPLITYVEAVDATELERLRAELNGRAPDGPRLTMLAFLVRAIVLACAEQPHLNAHYDSDSATLSLFDDVHVGVATQTAKGLIVPVVHHAGTLDLTETAREITRVAAAARNGSATRDELSGSTITITSLGAIGGLVTTPIVNAPEVAIVGVNKLERRPVWRNDRFEPRLVFNLSSSFDHRVVDGWDAATFIQRIKTLLELPALLFLDD
jgi:2-oxoisovalerate dehydrogenase E2 component (dihydrolipoyl transacylase)